MELIIGLIAAVAIGCFVFFRKKKEEAVAETAPYKVEPAPVTPEVVAVVETASVAVVEPVVPVTLEVAESAPVAVAEAKSAVKKSRAPKPSVKKAPAKAKTKSKKV
jgi:hypothetical protein